MEPEAKTAVPTQPTQRRRFEQLRALLDSGWNDRSYALLDGAIKRRPSDPNLWALKILALKTAKYNVAALQAWDMAVSLVPQHNDLVSAIATLAREQGNDNHELWVLNKALQIAPENEFSLKRLFALHVQRGNLAQGLVIAARLLAIRPDHEPYRLRRAACLADMNQFIEAEKLLETVVTTPTVSDAGIQAWARFLIERVGRAREAAERLETMTHRPAATWLVHLWLGKALAQSDRAADAIAALKQAAELAPNEPQVWYELAVIQRHAGLLGHSQQSLWRSLKLNPDNPTALRVAGYEHNYEYGDAPFQLVTLALSRMHRFDTRSRVEVHYAAAKALEDVGEREAAFEHYARAGELQKTLISWTDAPLRRLLSVLKRNLDPAKHRHWRAGGYPTNKPVFVVGMPRSGTSLIEQIIASHPQAYGAGEIKAADAVIDGLKIEGTTVFASRSPARSTLQTDVEEPSLSERGRRYVDELEAIGGSDVLRIVNKRPGNFTWLGLLDAALPGSYFIHMRRHPVDTCLSAYRLYFGDELPFSYDLRDLGRQYRLYQAFIAYWSDLVPKDRIIHVCIENVTENFESEVRRILNFVQLPWHDGCLRYFETQRMVRTASAIQVRRPLLRQTGSRWRDVEPYLGPLLEELGELVSDYERELARGTNTAQLAKATQTDACRSRMGE
jgi:tetratricopeptide (TPR) repeat protein